MLAGRDDSAGEDSDGGGSDLDRLPVDSSSDDEMGGAIMGQHLSGINQAGGPLGGHHYAPMGDLRTMALPHVQPLAHSGVVANNLAGTLNFPGQMHAGSVTVTHAATAGRALAQAATASELGNRKPGAVLRPAAATEDPTIRRIKAQVMSVCNV